MIPHTLREGDYIDPLVVSRSSDMCHSQQVITTLDKHLHSA